MPEVKEVKATNKEVKATPKKVAPKTPRVNYKELYEEQLEVNKQLERTNEVNQNDVMQIAKQRDDVTKAYKEVAGITNASNFIIKNEIKSSKAVITMLGSMRELLEVALTKTITTALDEKVVRTEELEDIL